MRTLGPYTILEQLGRGGQGVVYLAEDTRLKRKVALKVIETIGEDMPADRLERFRREAESASKLDHPNVCAIHEFGEADGVPYIAMRYVEGETLAEQIEAARTLRDSGTDSMPSTREHLHAVLHRIEKVARALHVAHEQGLIHRDIKPGNIMLTGDDEPVVLDFGLARDEFGDELSLTHSGDLLGTPAYMSPEQLMAQRIPLDRRTDIYSLGATLYESLTLKRPFEALTRAELYQRILTHEPSSATSVNRSIPTELKVVLETALEKDRDRRYHTALDFAEDLRRVRQFQPIQAKPIGSLLRTRRWMQRHPARAMALLGLILALVVAVGFLVDRQSVLQETRALALASAAIENVGADQALALLLAREAVAIGNSVKTRSALHRALARARERQSLKKVCDGGRCLPDGRLLVWSGEALELLDAQGRSLAVFLHEKAVDDAVASPDEDFLISASGDQVWFWHTKTGRSEKISCAGVTSVEVSGDGARFLALSDAGVLVWELATRRQLHLLEHTAPPGLVPKNASATFDRGGSRVLTTHYGTARVWTLDEVLTSRKLEHAPGEGVRHAVFTPDDSILGSILGKEELRKWSLDGSLTRTLDRQPSSLTSISVRQTSAGEHRFGRFLTSSSHSGLHLQLFDLADGQPIAEIRAVDQGTRWFDISFDCREIVGFGGRIRIWDSQLPDLPVLRHPAVVRSIDVAPDGEHIVTACYDGLVRVWTREGHLIAQSPAVAPAGMWRARFSPDSQRIAVCGGLWKSRTAWITNLQCVPIRELPGHDQNVNDVRFVPGDAGLVVTCGNDPSVSVRVWGQTGAPKFPLNHHGNGGANELAVSRDGMSVLVPGNLPDHGRALLWPLRPDAEPLVFAHDNPRYRGNGLSTVDLSADGLEFVTGCGDFASLWATADRTKPVRVFEHGGQVLSVRISPDGRTIATGSRDRFARLWSRDGTLLAKLPHEGIVSSVAFTPDGRRVLTGGWEGTVRVWHVQLEELLRVADERLSMQRFELGTLESYRTLLGDRIDELAGDVRVP